MNDTTIKISKKKFEKLIEIASRLTLYLYDDEERHFEEIQEEINAGNPNKISYFPPQMHIFNTLKESKELLKEFNQ
jgi:hypothetical protein